MIASFNPKLKTLTFLSIPRDLYVKYPWGGGGRINYIFAREYLRTRSFDKAAEVLEKKIKEIT
jgi:anionic cell wall polymer biosynthesis LytR-Cps2A-Psr (LCP) family protein